LRLRFTVADKIRIGAACFMVLVYLFLHLGRAFYNETGVWIFRLAPLFGDNRIGSAITFKPYTAVTPYGNIEVKAFTKIGYNTTFGGNLTIRSIYSPKRVRHNISVLNNSINQGAIFVFYESSNIDWKNNQDDLRYIQSQQDFIIGDYNIGIGSIEITKKNNEERFKIETITYPATVVLSDGTEIYTPSKQGIKGEKHLHIVSGSDTWVFDAWAGYMTVTKYMRRYNCQ
jgi:hypothetical protein